jgi:hypothetical protein
MAFNGSEGEFITLNEGADLTGEFRSSNPTQPLAYFFGREKLEELLAQDNCMGIRIYFGEKNNTLQLVLVSANDNQDDLLDKILDRGGPFPPRTSSTNALNS